MADALRGSARRLRPGRRRPSPPAAPSAGRRAGSRCAVGAAAARWRCGSWSAASASACSSSSSLLLAQPDPAARPRRDCGHSRRRSAPCDAFQNSTTRSISWSETKQPWMRASLADSGAMKSMSPRPSSFSAPGRIQDHPAVDLRGDGEGDARREVGLDQPGDHVHAGALGGQHQVDAGRPRHLRQPADLPLDVVGRGHHQVGQLVDHQHDVGQRLDVRDAADLAVVLDDVAHAACRQRPVAVVHLQHAARPARRSPGSDR